MSENTRELRNTHFTDADFTGARFRKVHLNDARFRMVDLSGVVMRDVDLSGAALDGEIDGLRINDVEVASLIEAELTRRNPARVWRSATAPDELRAAWAALERTWPATYDKAAALPPGSVDVSVQEEWSFTQTLRHLVFVTDAWLGAIRGGTPAFHPWALPFTDLPEFIDRPVETLGVDPDAAPSYPEVLAVRADRMAQVRNILADLTPQRMGEDVEGPVWMGGERLSVHRCLRVIFNEECEHLRFAERDLDALAAVTATTSSTRAVVG
jgi:hypothetical protein